MAFSELRTQLLANVRCLYGSGAEVLTLCVDDNSCGQHQAIIVSFDSLSSTWTKYLHSGIHLSAEDTIYSLLIESGREITSFLASSGHTVPFQGVGKQTVSLPCGQPYRSCTPAASTLPESFCDDLLHFERSAEVTASAPLADQNSVNEADADDKNAMLLAAETIHVPEESSLVSQAPETGSFPNIAIDETRPDHFSFHDCPVEKYPAESPDEPLKEEVLPEPIEDLTWGFSSTSKRRRRKAYFLSKSILLL
ncbi:uncharacterized protein RAG0_03070 [Rhynchosporium agropyri]|uniref:Uncharacterized protein n=1 Tax=Rhynchosporium agropyri TaxID=914238 RepID=A0A1E1K3B0_9HELO|nr:uncharacterized protein RAG0_03070 [Rhynchosporium agropyri]